MRKIGFEFRGEPVTLLTLYIYSDSPTQLRRFLSQKIGKAPTFFRHAPLLLDTTHLQGDHLPVADLIQICRESGLIPVGWRGVEVHRNQIQSHGLAIFGRSAEPSEQDPLPPPQNLLVSEPVRSGQSLYSRGDLTVVGPVNPGGEVIAEGNVHIYGPLRGRAIAGAQGERTCRIFCQRLDAELVAIAGHYLLHEDFPKTLLNRAVQILLQEGRLRLETIPT